MTNAVQLYWRYVSLSARGQMQYRGSFLLLIAAQIVRTMMEFVILLVLMSRFHTVGGWRLPEVALCYGMVSLAFALCEMTTPGFEYFNEMVRDGRFDRLLLRPRTASGQVLATELRLRDVGRLIQGLAVLLWAASGLEVHWTLGRVALLIGAILGGACMFSGLFVLQATMCFWTVESLEVVNCFTYGGVFAGNYPLTIYRTWFRRFFTFIVPLACVNYLPLGALVGRSGAPGAGATALAWGSPLLGVAFLVVSLQFWRFGVRRYRSTGS